MSTQPCPNCEHDLVPGRLTCWYCGTLAYDPNGTRVASLGKRFLAFVLDACVIPFSLMVPLGVAGAILEEAGGEDLAAAMTLFLFLGYLGVQVSFMSRGCTLGKRLLGLRVVHPDGRRATFGTMLGRQILQSFCVFTGFIGLLVFFLDGDRQFFYDRAVGTLVVDIVPQGGQLPMLSPFTQMDMQAMGSRRPVHTAYEAPSRTSRLRSAR